MGGSSIGEYLLTRSLILASRSKFILVHSVTPLTLGTLIYLLWRSESLTVFGWLKMIHLSGVVSIVRHYLSSWAVHLPGWFLYSLPDGLWLYSATAGIGGLWLDDWRTEAWLWVSAPLALGCAIEMGQFTSTVPGTFSAADLAAYFFGCVLAWISINANRAKGNQNEPKIPS